MTFLYQKKKNPKQWEARGRASGRKQRAAQQDSYHPPARCDSLISAGLSSPLIQHPSIIPHFSSFNPCFYLPPFSYISLNGNQRKPQTSVEQREGKKNRADETAKAKTNREENIYLRLWNCSKRWGENNYLRFVFSHRTTTKYCKLHCNHSQSCSENLMVITEYDCKTINAHLKHLLS